MKSGFLPVAEAKLARELRGDDQPGPVFEQQLDSFGSRHGDQLDRRSEFLALKDAVAFERHVRGDLGVTHEQQAEGQHDGEGCCEDDELRQTGRHARQQAQCGQPRVCTELGGSRAPQRMGGSSAEGVGTVSSTSRTTSSGRMR